MYKSLVFGDEFLAQGLLVKSHQRCSAGIRTLLSAKHLHFCVVRKKEHRTCLERHEGELMMADIFSLTIPLKPWRVNISIILCMRVFIHVITAQISHHRAPHM